MTPVLFLDFDGVLNHFESRRRVPDGWNKLDPACVELVNKIVETTSCLVVVSSSWRLEHPDAAKSRDRLTGILREHGFRHAVHDITPRSVKGVTIHNSAWHGHLARGLEIQEWMDLNEFTGSFCILDDSRDMAHLVRNLVRTCDTVGLQPHHAAAAITMLTTPICKNSGCTWPADETGFCGANCAWCCGNGPSHCH